MDELKVIGIDEKGYGKVYKAVMLNPGIPVTAKALYAYFSSYAGSGTTAFPHREKIIQDLQITKNTFTKHLNCLVDAKYIARKRTATGNIYSILLTVPNKDGEMVEAKSLGYGTVPKLAMLDERLTADAKGIYAYLCSYAGSGNVAYPRRGTILRELDISEGKYYRHYNTLIELGYVTPAQRTGERGQYSSCTYTLNETLRIGPATDPGETALKSDFDEVTDGGKPAGSRNRGYDDSTSTNRVINNNYHKKEHGKKSKPQKQMSYKTASTKLGRPDAISSIEEDGISNIRAPAREGDAKSSSPVLTKQQVKELCHYDYLLTEFGAWASLKDTLGHFDSSSQKAVFLAYCKAACNELVYQLTLFFGRTAEHAQHNGRRYAHRELVAKLKDRLADRNEVFHVMCYIADNRSEVRCLRGYIKQTVVNLATEAK